MKLGNLIDPQVKNQLYDMVRKPVTEIPWRQKPVTERVQLVTEHATSQTPKIRQFLNKNLRRATKDMPKSTGMVTGLIVAKAAEISQAKPHLSPEYALNQAMHGIASAYGYKRPVKALAHDFDRFELRQKNTAN